MEVLRILSKQLGFIDLNRVAIHGNILYLILKTSLIYIFFNIYFLIKGWSFGKFSFDVKFH